MKRLLLLAICSASLSTFGYCQRANVYGVYDGGGHGSGNFTLNTFIDFIERSNSSGGYIDSDCCGSTGRNSIDGVGDPSGHIYMSSLHLSACMPGRDGHGI